MIMRTTSLSDDSLDEEQRRPVPAGLYSFLCIQKGLSDDYLQLSLAKAENVMMGTVTLVHVSLRKLYQKIFFRREIVYFQLEGLPQLLFKIPL